MAPRQSEERRVKSEDIVGTRATETQNTANVPERQKPHPPASQAPSPKGGRQEWDRNVVPVDGSEFNPGRNCCGFGVSYRSMNGSVDLEQAFPFGEGGTAAGRDG